MDVRERTRDDFRIVWGVGMGSLRDDLANVVGERGSNTLSFLVVNTSFFSKGDC